MELIFNVKCFGLRFFESVWGALKALLGGLGAAWGRLGHLGQALELLNCVLDASWECPEEF